jgi:hypothetical protein
MPGRGLQAQTTGAATTCLACHFDNHCNTLFHKRAFSAVNLCHVIWPLATGHITTKWPMLPDVVQATQQMKHAPAAGMASSGKLLLLLAWLPRVNNIAMRSGQPHSQADSSS